MSALLTAEADEIDLLAQTENWAPEAKERAMRAIKDRVGKKRKVWYCANPGRKCDGAPHDGVPYRHARGDQWPPGGNDWFQWLLAGGRGSGKTRSGAEYIRRRSRDVSRIAVIAATAGDARQTMIEGESGLRAVFAAAGEEIHYEPSKRLITFPSGSIATVFSGEEPDRLRGPQHGLAWLDEPAHYPLIQEVYDQLLFGLRLGDYPRVVMTTTPLPSKWLKARIAEPNSRVSRVSTYANIDNLAKSFADTVISKYEGTRLGRQELHGEVLEDVEGALWNSDLIVRLPGTSEMQYERIVIAIDPAGTNNRRSDETGIVAVARLDGEGVVLADATGKFSPSGWANAALSLYERLSADVIVVEKNFGGDMVKSTLESVMRERGISARIVVKTAMRSKALRAEPAVALYEQSRVKHAVGLQDLETEMLEWVPGKGDSPNRVDALVWGLDELKLNGNAVAKMSSPAGRGIGGTTQAHGQPPTTSPGGLHLPPNFPFRRTA